MVLPVSADTGAGMRRLAEVGGLMNEDDAHDPPPPVHPRRRRPVGVRGARRRHFDPPAHADQLERAITHFFAALSGGLADAGCTLVGHIKGTLTATGRGDVAFHATDLAVSPAVTGGVAGLVAGRRRSP